MNGDFGGGFVTYAEVIWCVLFVAFLAAGLFVVSFIAAHGLTLLIRLFKPDFLSDHREVGDADDVGKDRERVALVAIDFIMQTRLAKEREARRLQREIEAKALQAITGAKPPMNQAKEVFAEEIDLTSELAALGQYERAERAINSTIVEAVETVSVASDSNESRALYWLMTPTEGHERFVADFLAPKAGVRGTRWAFCSIGPKYRKTFSRRDAQLWASVLRKERDCVIVAANVHARALEKFRSEKQTQRRGHEVTQQAAQA